ncbi:MAG: HDOD domain-containing protein [Proteobacteria bacterium]|nr:HDOD domain-containing protein [Pseudomonadota bacterium]
MTSATQASLPSSEKLAADLAAIRIPACPAVVTEVLREARKDEPNFKILARIISSDVGMSAMAVKLANSPMFGSAAQVKSVQQAINRLGTSNILNIIVAAALRSSVDGLPADFLQHFWDMAASRALCAGLLARKHVGIQPEDAYTYGLFQNAAVPVLMQHFSTYAELYVRAGEHGDHLVALERAHFHSDHAVVGWLLARNWGLPPKIASAIQHHHNPERYILPEEELPSNALALIAVTQLAEYIITELGGAALDVSQRAFEDARSFLGTTDHDLDEFREIVAAALA